MFDVGSLVEGKVYRFTWKRQSGNYRWYEVECQAVYIDTTYFHYAGGEVVVSSRPKGLTGWIPIRHITEAVDVGEPDHDGTNIRLPKQRPGAVDAPEQEA